MRVLVLANSSSGLWLFRRELINKLIKDGCNVCAVSPDDGRFSDLKLLGCEVIDVPIDRRGTNPIKDIFLIKKYIKIINEYKPDLVITYTIKPNIYGGMACRLKRIPYTANITGLGTAFQNTGALRKIVSGLYKVALRRAKKIFFENSANMKFILENKIASEKQAYLLNGAGVNIDYFYIKEYPRDRRLIKFLFIGRVMQEKGVNELLNAIQKTKQEGFLIELDIVGEMEEDYSSIFNKYIKEGWLHYHGFQQDVRPYIAECDCFILPSWHEGMANTNLECAAMGRPVITSDIPGCREAVIDGVSGYLCQPKNPDDIVACIKKFLQLSRPMRARMGYEGRKHIEKYFNKKSIVSETIGQLYEILAER